MAIKIKKFRIENYKSIIDSGDCYLEDTITILAGKNESGKTSILEALEDFNLSSTIRESAKHLDHNSNPTISITFVVDKSTISEIIPGDMKLNEETEIELVKTYPNTYDLSSKTLKHSIFKDIDKSAKKTLKNATRLWEELKSIHNKHGAPNGKLPALEIVDLDSTNSFIANTTPQLDDNIHSIPEGDDQNSYIGIITDLGEDLYALVTYYSFRKSFLDKLKNRIPNFILFSTFEDVLPSKILFSELEGNEWISYMESVSGLNTTIVQGESDYKKRNHKGEINIRLKDDYGKFWGQDSSKLTIDWDSEKLEFWIEENNKNFAPEWRSKGKQWHLDFYIKISALSKRDVSSIILIDEPGLYLHATAQKDILKKLEDAAQTAQVVFSTHSPYLIDNDKLNRLRLVQRTAKRGTRIRKVHALADKEALTPIITAIGVGIGEGITDLSKKCNVVTEGPSDLYYLNAFKLILGEIGKGMCQNVNFIFGGGANMPIIGSILHGWGVKVIYLYDNDKGKKQGVKNLKKNWYVLEDDIISIRPKGSIEDIFSVADFKKFALNDENQSYEGKNSGFLKSNRKYNKVLIAQEFLSKCQKGVIPPLDKETMSNITTLLQDIELKFSDRSPA